MNRSMKDVEREIEESRARLDRTIDRLQDKLSVSSAVDEVIGGVRRSQYGGVVEQVLTSIRNNPVPVLVALAGVGWLLRRVERESSEARRAEVRPPRRDRTPRYPPPTARDTGFIRDTDIDPDLQPYGAPGLEPGRPAAPIPDPTRPGYRRTGEV
ncbi:MAG TPA: DUF3618 domain-containing protein [Saliniramus sp.]|nr:DUF3618 domain-containing protein [Saliniramus sp.]